MAREFRVGPITGPHFPRGSGKGTSNGASNDSPEDRRLRIVRTRVGVSEVSGEGIAPADILDPPLSLHSMLIGFSFAGLI
ncbi:MAG: hypothetical protein A4E45_01707 [Methanosaeta sp. PtaB.Bin039]|nr:MAG: hypothetical protein A4E45_01707 [Methanosaeta sp. PtaB.Bin039]OPY44978.1 MAG: hypothetical protein A4E47_01212 [Methanosaeta sp. PtaU1.Bin028]